VGALANIHSVQEALCEEIQVSLGNVGQRPKPGEEALHRQPGTTPGRRKAADHPGSLTGCVQLIFHVTAHY
jgi:hypothetical protein